MESLEDQYERRKNSAARKITELGYKLLAYTAGFTWCPDCHYVSNMSIQRELRHRRGPKGCQRRSCKGCNQRDAGHSPYEEGDFVYEGEKVQKACEAYTLGIKGCPEGNKCLDKHNFWDEADPANENRC